MEQMYEICFANPNDSSGNLILPAFPGQVCPSDWTPKMRDTGTWRAMEELYEQGLVKAWPCQKLPKNSCFYHFWLQ